MLAKIHIAKKELGLDDELYRVILEDEFGVKSAAYLSVKEMEKLVSRFVSKGWKSGKKETEKRPPAWRASGPEGRNGETETRQQQAEKLKERIGQEIAQSELTEQRMRGLIRKICNVDDLKWCGDAVRLKQLLAIIGRMKDQGEI